METSASLVNAPKDYHELPKIIWENIVDYLAPKDINNLHLASKSFNDIANLYLHKMRLKTQDAMSMDNLENLQLSSRIYKAISICEATILDADIKKIEAMFERSGNYITDITLNEVTMRTSTFSKMMSFMPNLEFLTLVNVRTAERESEQDQTLILRKLKNVKIEHCSNEYEYLMRMIQGSKVKEATLGISGSPEITIPNVSTFLRTNQETLKKLIISFKHHAQNIIWDFQEMQLQHFELEIDEESNNILEFLNHWMRVDTSASFTSFLRTQKQMEYLRFGSVVLSDEAMEAISSGMPKLETLSLGGCLSELSDFGLSHLAKIDSLKNLLLGEDAGQNVFVGFIGRVKENLQQLEVDFDYYYDNADIAAISRSMPNLKKLLILAIEDTENIQFALENFESLEDVTIASMDLKLNINKELPRLKKLSLQIRFPAEGFCSKIQLKRKFCKSICNNMKNLEYLKIAETKQISKYNLEILLEGLPNLREIYMEETIVFSKEMLKSLNRFGRHLKKFHVDNDFQSEAFVRHQLKDCQGLQFSCKNFDITI